ncbi:hypothetical protein T4D_7540 [Trichinella pseudospiralis]|uniref:Uncharacterized protein n=1 Tax=Trichinella pseudospiralis TaxID=6337 RepID=A0A0V1FW19_TRIPS|nr:hypothetical protein T4D_7540 [Trichinella pseudospiralis]
MVMKQLLRKNCRRIKLSTAQDGELMQLLRNFKQTLHTRLAISNVSVEVPCVSLILGQALQAPNNDNRLLLKL